MQDTALRAPELAAWLANTDIGLLELRTPTGTLRLGRQGDNIVELPEEETEETESVQVKAPSVGTYLHSHPSAPAALASVGQRVNPGQVIGLLNIGPLLLPVTAPQTGIVDAIHVANGAAVGYGTVLIDLHPL
ncbi:MULTISPECIES: acetyl-CoA carboxylase biotin carboxyl carrier protein [Variovorax]|jgi:acetyl-CoA carboxylase biotin carboxyl carrier protein|uniref:acetyl-CoA carboxylase biotin carboxyl carrier protein n=1 Tax=Variovorax TaxID=34072 RepID=UPI00086F879E|nr:MULTISPECIES: acetyl-CoA carboxylase biotin carboxyl carrier protein subunit [Variovorax]MBN8757799.1 acetyl-CoA carboxylase biotin carboxyl carrier protein subunit [Variovorax sp.]ODU18070.1 MAG: acetyl-CoA carboxylase biotin carboxyl carrier protein subunit [Variovorax sp. SCN 67-85]ODV24605.1 MAG: acetyl-CoA carboxylase biotin carboxyl carrier protein subunit [Variovorax sp. SCN 67-20]OJZ13457.1 MAG: acetyl-CoA carboxylase biotin carboxyl carrier protein subunit [Variovorax sp. 67-131]UK